LKISLSPELERLLTEKIESGRYHSVDEVIRKGLELLQANENTAHSGALVNSESVVDLFASIASEVPESEWGQVPADLSTNLDYYLYGSNAKSR
jgi:putative addiction module CopG family antidote